MNINQKEHIKYKNPFVLPVLGIAFLIIVTLTVSYGYYAVNGTKAVNTSNGNVGLPRKCTLTTENSSASITVNKTFLRIDDPVSAGGAYGIATTTSSYIRLNGSTDCSCTYNVVLYQEGSTYTRSSSSTTEFMYYVGGRKSAAGTNAVSPEYDGTTIGYYPYDFTNFSSGTRVGYGTIKVVTAGTQVTHTWTYSQAFYNLPDVNQISQQGKSFKYSLRFIVNSCTF